MTIQVVERTVDSSGADYDSMSAFEVGEKRHLPEMRHYEVTLTSGAFMDGEDVTFSGGGSGRFFEIFPGTGNYRIELDLASVEPAVSETITGDVSTAEATIDAIPVDAGEIARAILGAFNDTTALTIDPTNPSDVSDSWNTSTLNYIHFYVPLANRHSFVGFPNDGSVFSHTVGTSTAVEWSEHYTLFEGIVGIATSASFNYALPAVAPTTPDIDNTFCYFYRCAISSAASCIATIDSANNPTPVAATQCVMKGNNFAMVCNDAGCLCVESIGIATGTLEAFRKIQFSNVSQGRSNGSFGHADATNAHSTISFGIWTTNQEGTGASDTTGNNGSANDERTSGDSIPFDDTTFVDTNSGSPAAGGTAGGSEEYRPTPSGVGAQRLFIAGDDISDLSFQSQWGSNGADYAAGLGTRGPARNFWHARQEWLDADNLPRRGGLHTFGPFEIDPPTIPVSEVVVDPDGGGDYTSMSAWEADRRRRLPWIWTFTVSSISAPFTADERVTFGTSGAHGAFIRQEGADTFVIDMYESRFENSLQGFHPQVGETITGATSGETADVDSIDTKWGEIERVLVRGTPGSDSLGAFTITRDTSTTLFNPSIWKANQHAYVEIRPDDGHRHLGIYDDTRAYHTGADGTWNIRMPWTRIIGLQFLQPSGTIPVSAGSMPTWNDANSPIYIEGCIFRRTSTVGILLQLDSACRGHRFNRIKSSVFYQDVAGNAAVILDVSNAISGSAVYITNTILQGQNTTFLIDQQQGTTPTVRGADENCHFVQEGSGEIFSNGVENWRTPRPGRGIATATNDTIAHDVNLQNVDFDDTVYQDTTLNSVDIHLADANTLFRDTGSPVDETVSIDFLSGVIGGTGAYGANPLGEDAIAASDWHADLFDIDNEPRPIGPYDIAADESQAAVIAIDDWELDVGQFNEGAVSADMVAKATSVGLAGYLRPTLQAKDESSTVPDHVRRRVQHAYLIPAAAFYQAFGHRIDLGAAPSDVKEDGVRYFGEILKDAQSLLLDAPTVQTGKIGSSFIHPEDPRASEEFRWADAINMNAFQVEFKWSPHFFGCADLDAELEIARFEADVNNYIALKVVPGNKFEREYSQDNVYGPHDPSFRLEKVRSGSVTETVDVVAYYGYDLVDPAAGRTEDVVKITVTNRSGLLMGLKIERYGIPGVAMAADDVNAFPLGNLGDIVYNGTGYYGNPVLVNQDTDPVNRPFGTSRAIPTGRQDALRRTFLRRRAAVLGGERDTLGGSLTASDPYEGDDFDRGDSGDLGADWDTLRETGQGADIVSNEVEIAEEGFEVWNRRLKHADVLLEGDVRIDTDTDLIGLMARVDTGIADVTALGVELVQTGASAADLRLVLWYNGTRNVLSTTALTDYTSGDTYLLRLETSGTTLTGTVIDEDDITPLKASASFTTSVLKKPGFAGIYGQTGGAGQNVYLDNFEISPNFENGLE